MTTPATTSDDRQTRRQFWVLCSLSCASLCNAAYFLIFTLG